MSDLSPIYNKSTSQFEPSANYSTMTSVDLANTANKILEVLKDETIITAEQARKNNSNGAQTDRVSQRILTEISKNIAARSGQGECYAAYSFVYLYGGQKNEFGKTVFDNVMATLKNKGFVITEETDEDNYRYVKISWQNA